MTVTLSKATLLLLVFMRVPDPFRLTLSALIGVRVMPARLLTDKDDKIKMADGKERVQKLNKKRSGATLCFADHLSFEMFFSFSLFSRNVFNLKLDHVSF